MKIVPNFNCYLHQLQALVAAVESENPGIVEGEANAYDSGGADAGNARVAATTTAAGSDPTESADARAAGSRLAVTQSRQLVPDESSDAAEERHEQEFQSAYAEVVDAEEALLDFLVERATVGR